MTYARNASLHVQYSSMRHAYVFLKCVCVCVSKLGSAFLGWLFFFSDWKPGGPKVCLTMLQTSKFFEQVPRRKFSLQVSLSQHLHASFLSELL